MKRWAILTVTLYGLALLFLSLPGLLLLFGITHSGQPPRWEFDLRLENALEVVSHWGSWLTLAVFLAAQALLLLVPVARAEGRPTSRRRLLAPVVTASFLLGNLLFAGVFSIACAIAGDHASLIIEAPAAIMQQTMDSFPPAVAVLRAFGLSGNSDVFNLLTAVGLLVALWMTWALIFYHYAQGDAPDTLVRRATRWLLRGSILELLVAVPSHVIVRHREDCCAPFATFWGIVSGLSVMLLAYGPGVFFLFVRRIRDRRPPTPPAAEGPEAAAPAGRVDGSTHAG